MRRNLSCVIGLSISIFFAGLASTASAQATPHAELIKTLRHAHWLLAHADHDYDGHRAKAAEEVHKALKDLGYQHKKPQPGLAPAKGAGVPPQAAPGGQPKGHEPQPNSDTQLREAKALLEGALTHINGSRHPGAAANLKAAIFEIHTALKIK